MTAPTILAPTTPSRNGFTGQDQLPAHVEVLVIGSGAGGATTAARLADGGFEVAVLEEGPNFDSTQIATNSPAAIAALYRDRGLTPILGRPTIAFVEGRCVGGSTEINSAFWHRLPEDCYHRWRADALLADFSAERMAPYFDFLERELSVSYLAPGTKRLSSELFLRGIQRLGWQYVEVPRCQTGESGSPFAPGGKRSMQQTFIPRALAAGARLYSDCKVTGLRREGTRITGATVQKQGQTRHLAADFVFVCGGPIQTAALLRRSGITRNVGDNLRIHPMIKAAAAFDQAIRADEETLPIYQVKEFAPNITIGGSVFTPGFLAMLLADNWDANRSAMTDWDRMALYYAATRGMNRGTIRVTPAGGVIVRYQLTEADRQNLSAGLGHLGEILFAAGAHTVYPALRGQPLWRTVDGCRALLRTPARAEAMSLSTVHAFSSCPMGENPDFCATDSWGKVSGLRNLYINDASLIPDSPGVNPQGTVMAIALRNCDRFIERMAAQRRKRTSAATADILLTGAPGWLGSRFLEVLRSGLPGRPELSPAAGQVVRCLVQCEQDATEIASSGVEVVYGDLSDPAATRALCDNSRGALLFHLAGVVHPRLFTREHQRTNVEGTRRLLAEARAAGVRRVIAVSSNSPFGANARRDQLFDESSPYHPYMSYGRSKRRMEEAVREAQADGALETVILRPPWFYGPHQPPRQTLFFKMIKDGRFPVLGDGQQLRSMAYVDNICQALLLAASTVEASGETYWIADERPYSINEIVATVCEVITDELGAPCAPRQLHLPATVGDLARLADAGLQAIGLYQQQIHVLGEMNLDIACSIDKAKRELGYAPVVALREGMRESIRWCLAQGMTF